MKLLRKQNKLKLRKILLGTSIFLTIGAVTSSIVFSTVYLIYKYENPTITVVRVIDGDTFEDSKLNKYRLLGIDTPESFDSSKNFEETSGIENLYATKAKKLSEKIILNNKIEIRRWKIDKYNRVLVRANSGTKDLAKELLSNGLARVKYISSSKENLFFYPDIDYYNQLKEIQKYAKVNKKGIWALSTLNQAMVFPK